MKLQHQHALDQLPDCPPKDYEGREMMAYRWVFDDMGNEKNFLPVLLQNPSRFLKKNAKEKCMGMGLSMFDSWQNAEKRFAEILLNLGDMAYERFGTQIAVGLLNPNDGLSGKSDLNGHFTHYPSETVDYPKKFEAIKKL